MLLTGYYTSSYPIHCRDPGFTAGREKTFLESGKPLPRLRALEEQGRPQAR
ncbi:MAG TPA: hypothetical protein VEW48_15270 [Thermoanaerobaculia bacterium]|nr:hypothetical protein [Thermoanaerobaculia bacterium]